MDLPEPIRAVQAALRQRGVDARVISVPDGAATAADAARAVGCPLGAMAKSLLFLADGEPVLVVAAGDRQVDVPAPAALLGVGRERVKLAGAEAVLQVTGFPVGGVPPLGHPRPLAPTWTSRSSGSRRSTPPPAPRTPSSP
ncbi:MAG TPA: YbaK/EbsC family protein [Dehalococcoidia bacterium]